MNFRYRKLFFDIDKYWIKSLLELHTFQLAGVLGRRTLWQLYVFSCIVISIVKSSLNKKLDFEFRIRFWIVEPEAWLSYWLPRTESYVNTNLAGLVCQWFLRDLLMQLWRKGGGVDDLGSHCSKRQFPCIWPIVKEWIYSLYIFTHYLRMNSIQLDFYPENSWRRAGTWICQHNTCEPAPRKLAWGSNRSGLHCIY